MISEASGMKYHWLDIYGGRSVKTHIPCKAVCQAVFTNAIDEQRQTNIAKDTAGPRVEYF